MSVCFVFFAFHFNVGRIRKFTLILKHIYYFIFEGLSSAIVLKFQKLKNNDSLYTQVCEF